MATPQIPTPPETPYTLGDFWPLVPLAFGLLLISLGFTADPDDTAEMLGLTQGPACWLLGILCLVAFYFFIRRNKRLFGRYFSNRSAS